jgi:hypothetical protein
MFKVPECGKPPSVTGGFWEPDSDSNGQSANLNCQDGFYLNKTVQISCMSNNTWSNIDGVCMSGKYTMVVLMRLLKAHRLS